MGEWRIASSVILWASFDGDAVQFWSTRPHCRSHRSHTGRHFLSVTTGLWLWLLLFFLIGADCPGYKGELLRKADVFSSLTFICALLPTNTPSSMSHCCVRWKIVTSYIYPLLHPKQLLNYSVDYLQQKVTVTVENNILVTFSKNIFLTLPLINSRGASFECCMENNMQLTHAFTSPNWARHYGLCKRKHWLKHKVTLNRCQTLNTPKAFLK